MRIAVIIDNIYMAELERETKIVVLFEAERDLVTATDQDIVSLSDINYLCLWLLGKTVARLYCNGISPPGRELLEKAGIEVYPLDDIRDHPMLKALLIRGRNEKMNS